MPEGARRGVWRRTTARDHVFEAIKTTPMRMVRRDDKGEQNDLLDRADMKVGNVQFDGKLDFMGGTVYGEMVVKGRTKNKHDALWEFVRIIERLGGNA